MIDCSPTIGFCFISVPAVTSLRSVKPEGVRDIECRALVAGWSWGNYRGPRPIRRRPLSCGSLVRRVSPIARRPRSSSSEWAARPCPPCALHASRATWKSRPGPQTLLAEDRDGPARPSRPPFDSTSTARHSRTWRRRSAGRPASRSRSIRKTSPGGKISASPSRHSQSSAFLEGRRRALRRRFAPVQPRTCKGLPVSRTRYSRSPKA